MGCGNSKSIKVKNINHHEQNEDTDTNVYVKNDSPDTNVYVKNDNGLMERTIDYSVHFKDTATNKKPHVKPENLYLDSHFECKLPERNRKNSVKRKRPKKTIGCDNSNSIKQNDGSDTNVYVQNDSPDTNVYVQNDNMLMERTIDYSVHYKDTATNKKPHVKPENLYIDPDFECKLPERNRKNSVKRKRPKEPMGCDNSKSIKQNHSPDTNGYVQNDNGLMERTLDYRFHFKDTATNQKPNVKPDNLYLDSHFECKLPEKNRKNSVKWKRPKEFRENPKLFSDDTSRSDVGQGSIGNCWFLAVVANIADNKELMKQVLPESAYYIEHPELYDGIFHARFFSFGKWLDVYVDDILPVTTGGTLLGAQCEQDKNVMWVPLFEKAFAKLHGSYEAICSGYSEDAYVQLTGGIGEGIEHKDMSNKGIALFERIKNALLSNHQVTTSVSSENHRVNGLIGGHAYSVVAVNQVLKTKLLQIRNPWGSMEWTGAWSEGSTEWKTIPENTLRLPKKNQGEFFVCLEDYMEYFIRTTICSLTPDFDMDGRCDLLNYVLNIYGEWFSETAAGFQNILKNPRFSFVVSEKDARSDGKVPIFVQMIQQSQRQMDDNFSILCDILRVVADQDVGRSKVIILEEEQREIYTYSTGVQYCYRFNLDPGCYTIIPTTKNGDREMKAFLLRIFSPGPLNNVRKIQQDVELTTCRKENFIEMTGEKHFFTYEKVFLGKFIFGVNAGGPITNELNTHFQNPQYVITIPDTGADVPVVMSILQKQEDPKCYVGVNLYNVTEERTIPLDMEFVFKNLSKCESQITGKRHYVLKAWEVTLKYALPAGKYVAVVYLEEKIDKEFSILVKSTVDIGFSGFQTGFPDR